ncbi:MAG: anaerobic ribonucleoside-triphosphate reductase, partial [bacterium]
MNIKESVEEYLNGQDWRVKANANQGYSLGGLVQHLAGKAQANYWLDEVYPKKAANLHRAGAIHIHDLDMLSTYCVGHSLPTLLATGFAGVDGKVASKPPKHLSSAIGQMVNYLGTLQNESAGAQAFSSFDTLLAPYVWIDGLRYAEVKQEVQEFVYAMNVGSRFGAQPVFSNLTFDWTCPADLRDKHPVIAGKELKSVTYGKLEPEMGMINRAFLEVMLDGDANGRAHTFPIPTYNIIPGFDWDTQNAKLLLELTAKYGLPYFQNFVNSDLNPGDVRSMCPLHPDTLVPVRGPSGISVSAIKDIYQAQEAGRQYEVLVDGQWVPAIATEHASKAFCEILMENGASVVMESRHEQLVRREEDRPEEILIAEELQAGMLLPFNKRPLCEEGRNNSLAGYAVGTFLAYGTAEDGRLEYSPATDGMMDKLKQFYEGLAFDVETVNRAGRIKLIVSGGGNEAVKWMDQFVCKHELARRVWNLGPAFMQGVLGGLTNPMSKNILCLNANRVNEVQALCTLCGLDYVTNSQGTGALITVGGLKEEKLEKYQWVPIKSITGVPSGSLGTCYCFAVSTEDHLFTLASGLVTHNCRLQLDLGELTKRGGGLFGANDQTGSIGV